MIQDLNKVDWVCLTKCALTTEWHYGVLGVQIFTTVESTVRRHFAIKFSLGFIMILRGRHVAAKRIRGSHRVVHHAHTLLIGAWELWFSDNHKTPNQIPCCTVALRVIDLQMQ